MFKDSKNSHQRHTWQGVLMSNLTIKVKMKNNDDSRQNEGNRVM